MARLETRKSKSKSNASEVAERAWQHAIRLLAARDRSEQEIRDRLAAGGETAATITATVRRLRQRRYLDDQRLALGAGEHAVRRGYGSEYLRAQLGHKGVADRLIDEAVEAAYTDEIGLARRVLARKFPVEPQRPAERARAARFLLRRGFPESVVFAILDEAC